VNILDKNEIKRRSLASMHTSVVTTAARNTIPPTCSDPIDRRAERRVKVAP